jgi:hypothetical protein
MRYIWSMIAILGTKYIIRVVKVKNGARTLSFFPSLCSTRSYIFNKSCGRGVPAVCTVWTCSNHMHMHVYATPHVSEMKATTHANLSFLFTRGTHGVMTFEFGMFYDAGPS